MGILKLSGNLLLMGNSYFILSNKVLSRLWRDTEIGRNKFKNAPFSIEEFLTENTSDKESPKMLSISPNPSRGDGFVVISEINNLDYKIVDLGGKSIQIGVLQKGSQDIYIEGPGGVYFLQYKNEAGKVTSVELIKMR